MLWLLVSIIIVWFVYFKIYKPRQYWQEKGVTHVKPWPIFGNLGPAVLRRKPLVQVFQHLYSQFPNSRYVGFHQFSMPSLLIRDPDLIKRIFIRDFDKFTDRTDFVPESSDPFWKKSLGALSGKKWHDMRVLLSPAFTSSKMKAMFSLMVECAEEFINYFEREGSGTITLEMKDTFNRFTNDVIASTSFGVKCNSLEDKENEFFMKGKSCFDMSGLRALKFFGYSMSPFLMNLLKITFIDKEMRSFFLRIVRETISYREETGIVRPDMIHLLREAQKGRLRHEDNNGVIDSGFAVVEESDLGKSKNNNKMTVTDEDITAQGVLFFFAGFDTVGALLCHAAYELAVNPEVQEKLAAEVDVTKENCGGHVITYEALLQMKYLDMVVTETLRLWSPAAFLNRKAVKPVTIEPVLPEEKPLHLEVDADCTIPVFAIHRDPKYYPNPDKFDPERFSNENKHNINPFTYMPFGIGPRNCIGNRFALLEAKTLIFFLLSKFEVVPVEKTSIPFVISKKDMMVINSANGYWLGLKPRKNNVQ